MHEGNNMGLLTTLKKPTLESGGDPPTRVYDPVKVSTNL